MINLYEGEEINFRENKVVEAKLNSDKEINEKYITGEVRIITEQARYPLNTILSMVNSDDYILNPEFQRRHRWDNVKKSRLMESFIMNVPIPPIFLYEIKYSVYEVMDGLQRMTAISQYYNDEFALEGLEEWPELNGKKYSNLPDQIKRGIDRRHLSSIILLQETAKSAEEARRLKQLVFERINSGGEKLTPQETRNALYPGALNKLCINLARYPSFCKMWAIPEPNLDEMTTGDISVELSSNPIFSKMDDVELVLRFFAYRQIEKWESPALEIFLDEFLRKGNMFSDQIIKRYEIMFKDTCDFIFEIFGEKAFWLYRPRQGRDNWLYFEKATKVLYDPMMYVLSNMLPYKEILIKEKDSIFNSIEQLHKDNYQILGGRNSNRNDVIKRIQVLESFFENFIKK